MEDARCFLVLDTESTVCLRRRRRMLVALAYQLVWPNQPDRETAMVYDIVSLPEDTDPDARSETIHGITVAASRLSGRPLRSVLLRLFRCLQHHEPSAIVGHDVLGDIRLLVSEAMLSGCACGSLPVELKRLICTRMIATPRCAIPLRRRGNPKRSAPSGPESEGFKWPSLTETYDLLVPAEVTTAPQHPTHDARGDVERCREVFLCLMKRPCWIGCDTASAMPKAARCSGCSR